MDDNLVPGNQGMPIDRFFRLGRAEATGDAKGYEAEKAMYFGHVVETV
jgi:hypothetical protein